MYVGLTLRCIEADYHRGLVKGMWYRVLLLEPLTLEEQTQRHGEVEKRKVEFNNNKIQTILLVLTVKKVDQIQIIFYIF